MADTRHQIEMDVGAALECAEAATWTANELVGRTLETAVSGKEAATTLHHAYNAQVHVARVLDWAKEWAHAQELASSNSPPSKLDHCGSVGCVGLAATRRSSADAFRHRRRATSPRRRPNGQRDGHRTTRKPKAEQKSRRKQLKLPSRQSSESSSRGTRRGGSTLPSVRNRTRGRRGVMSAPVGSRRAGMAGFDPKLPSRGRGLPSL
jgi:hypothetical protein